MRIANLPINTAVLTRTISRFLNARGVSGRNLRYPDQLARYTATSLAYLMFDAVNGYINYLPPRDAVLTALAVSATSRAGRMLRIHMLRVLVSVVLAIREAVPASGLAGYGQWGDWI